TEGRLRLHGRVMVARGASVRRYRNVVYRQDRVASAPVEDVDIALLGCLDQRWYPRAAHGEVDQRGLGGIVPVPMVAVHGLERPDQMAVREAQGNDGA